MSQFSQLLTDHIHTKNVKVYALAQYCNIDRANMYKFINGSRTPSSFDTVNKICNFMQLSPGEKDELVEAYQITQIGAENYYRRKHVAHFLKNFSIPNNDLPLLRPYQPPTGLNHKAAFFNSEVEINHALTGILTCELCKKGGKIKLLIQPDYDFFMNVLAIAWQNSNVQIEHIICLNNTKSQQHSKMDYNLHCLEKILPLYGNPYDYQCFYYYDNVDSRFGKLTLFPYMIITSDYAFLLSADMKKGYATNADDSVQMFSGLFDQYLKETLPLITPMEHPFFQFQSLAELIRQEIPAHSLQLSPCLTPLLDEDFLEKYVSRELSDRTEFMNTLKDYIALLNQNKTTPALNSVFSINGLQHFMKTGALKGYPTSLYLPVELSDRVLLLQKLISSFHAYDYRILKEDFCSLENELHLVISRQKGFLCFHTPQDNRLIYLDIKEPGFIFTFLDYYESLDEDLFYTEEEALELLKEVYEEYV